MTNSLDRAGYPTAQFSLWPSFFAPPRRAGVEALWESTGGSSSGLSDGDFGDVVVTGGGTVLTLDDGSRDEPRVLTANSTIRANRSRVICGPYDLATFVLTLSDGANLLVH